MLLTCLTFFLWIYVILGKTYDESGDLVATSQITTFVLSAGGFGGKRESNVLIPIIDEPKRSPDASVQEKTSMNQVGLLVSIYLSF